MNIHLRLPAETKSLLPEEPWCSICGTALDPRTHCCRDCSYGGLEPEAYVDLFWDEA